MKPGQNHNLPFHKLLILCFLCACVAAIPTRKAAANAAPPPTRVWLRFIETDGSAANFQSVQVIGCADNLCQNPILLKNYGKCDLAGCLSTPEKLSNSWKFDCAGNRCLFVYDRFHEGQLPPFMRLVTQSNARLQTSETFDTPPLRFYNGPFWKIKIAADTLTIADDNEAPTSYFPEQTFLKYYLANIVVEVIVAGIFLYFVGKKKHILALIGAVIVANLLSYPVAWLVIPSFGQFQHDSIRKWGVFILISVGIYSLIAIGFSSIKNNSVNSASQPGSEKQGEFWDGLPKHQRYSFRLMMKRNQRTIYIILTILSLPVCMFCLFLAYFGAAYGNYGIHVQGLPPGSIVPLAEAFALVYETIFIYLLGRKIISFRLVFLMCVLMNAASYLLSLLT